VTPPRPTVVCFCGSSRFIDHFGIWQWTAEREGKIALGLHWLPPSYRDALGRPAEDDHQAEAEDVAERMDELHKRKIDLADEVFILNVGGYVGDSTKGEIRYAIKHDKPLRWLEPESARAILRVLHDGIAEYAPIPGLVGPDGELRAKFREVMKDLP